MLICQSKFRGKNCVDPSRYKFHSKCERIKKNKKKHRKTDIYVDRMCDSISIFVSMKYCWLLACIPQIKCSFIKSGIIFGISEHLMIMFSLKCTTVTHTPIRDDMIIEMWNNLTDSGKLWCQWWLFLAEIVILSSVLPSVVLIISVSFFLSALHCMELILLLLLWFIWINIQNKYIFSFFHILFLKIRTLAI